MHPRPPRVRRSRRAAPAAALSRMSAPPIPTDPPASPAPRRLLHRRSLQVEVYALDAGRWEVCAELTDVKTSDRHMTDGVRRAGTPIHGLGLRLVIDATLQVLEAGSHSTWVPYPGHCEQHADAYRALVGLNLGRGFRRAVNERLGGARACTHLTELTQVLPTAVIQGLVGEAIDPRGGPDDNEPPFQLDRCHALRRDGEVVRLHYPRWYRQPRANKGTDNSERAG